VTARAALRWPRHPPARPRRDARRAPAVRHVSRWAHDLDMPGMRRGGVRAAATYRLPHPRRAGRGALGAQRTTEIKPAFSSRRSSSSASATSTDGSGPPRSTSARSRGHLALVRTMTEKAVCQSAVVGLTVASTTRNPDAQRARKQG
jgi:hypothetical protein